jgi:Family of unknown function (DUF5999)
MTPRAPSPSVLNSGGSLLYNGVILFEDTGELLPEGSSIPPHRPTHVHPPVAA